MGSRSRTSTVKVVYLTSPPANHKTIMKICTKCKLNKEDFEFYKDKRTKSGLFSACRKCCYIHTNQTVKKAWRLKHPGYNNKYVRTWYRKHPYQAYPEELKEYRRTYVNDYHKRPDQRPKYLARQLLNKAIKDGRAKKGYACENASPDCKGRLEAHHDNYAKPLDVNWFCKHHHDKYHQVIKQSKGI